MSIGLSVCLSDISIYLSVYCLSFSLHTHIYIYTYTYRMYLGVCVCTFTKNKRRNTYIHICIYVWRDAHVLVHVVHGIQTCCICGPPTRVPPTHLHRPIASQGELHHHSLSLNIVFVCSCFKASDMTVRIYETLGLLLATAYYIGVSSVLWA